MIDSYFRSPYQKVFVDPIVKEIKKTMIRPEHLTGLAILLGVVASVLIAFQFAYIAIALLLLSGYLDTLDGSLARLTFQTSPLGAVLDIIGDRLVEFSVVLGLFLVDSSSRGLVCILILGSILLCITSFLIVGIFAENQSEKSFHYSPGIMERTEAFIFFGLMILFPSYFSFIGLSFALLVVITAALRILQFSKSKK